MSASLAADDIRIVITDLDQDGSGVGGTGRHHRSEPGPEPELGPALEVHVPGALPGDEVAAHIVHRAAGRPVAWARLRAILRASPDRVAPSCRAQGACGGCVLQPYTYRAQLAWKAAALRREIERAPALHDVAVEPVVPSPAMLGYRNNSKLVAGHDGSGRLVLGAYAPRTHDIVDLAGCAVVEPPLVDAAAVLRGILEAHAVSPYDERSLTGCLRYVVLRANARGEVLATLVTATASFRGGDAVAAELRARCPHVLGVVANVNPTTGNALYGGVERTLSGSPTLADEIGTVRLRISSRAFFQANRAVAGLAYDAIARAASLTGSERVVDAYAGVGGIALTLAARALSVVGIEEHASAVADANASAALNRVTNARFVAGDVAKELERIEAADVVVLNPPRKGCADSVLERAAQLGARSIVYLSCAPQSLMRDLARLRELGYRTTRLQPFDMLPHTPHLEVLAILS